MAIYSYVKVNGIPPSADDLMLLKEKFAPRLTRIDTLRMWLDRHNGRVIRRVGGFRTYRYELNRQGVKRIRYLMFPFFEKAISIKKLGGYVDYDMTALYHDLVDFAVTFDERMRLSKLYFEFKTTLRGVLE